MRENLPLRKIAEGGRLLMLLVFLVALVTPTFGSLKTGNVFISQDDGSITVRGTVKDDEGQPLPGATILEKGTQNGTAADAEGSYELKVNENATLIVSFIGYETMELEVGGRSQLDVSLALDIESLKEVVVVGYGKQSKETLTGSISSVKGKEFVKSPQPNLSSSFTGRVPGVIALNRSGEPGYDDAILRIRGMSTPGDNNPLIVVDGVANRLGGLNRIDPNDVESISVLKDASAAIYGSQAANGVIIVTTKRGSKSKPTFSFTFNQGFVKPTVLPDMADAPTYAKILNEINYYRNPSGGMNQIYSDSEIDKFTNGSDPNNYPNTDWVGESIRKVAYQDMQNLSVGGGSDRASYYASLGRIHQEGIFQGGITNYDQISIRSNIDLNITDNLKVGFDISGRQEDRLFPTTGAGSIFRSIYRSYPTVPARYTNGLPSPGIENGANPVVIVTDKPGTDDWTTNVVNTLLNFEYKLPFLESVKLKGFYSEDRIFEFRKTFRTPFNVYQIDNGTNPASYNELTYGTGSGAPELTQSQGNKALTTYNFSINFEKYFNKHYLAAFIAYEQQKDQYYFFDAFRSGFLSDQIPEFNLGGGEPTQSSNSGYSQTFTRRNLFGRLSYDFNQKFLLEAQFRYDGSSRFADGSRYGFFPSISGGWRISEEPWFQVNAINNLKLRASYGSLGNDRVDPFQYLNSYQLRGKDYISSSLQTLPIFIINQLANPSITWETAKKLDIGLEANFLEVFSIELDYFHEQRNDLLTARQGSLPLVSGIVNEYGNPSIIPQENIGEVKNAGFEGMLSYNQTFGEVNVFASVNGTYAKNEVIFLDDAEGIPDYQLRKGKPLNSYLVYKTIGIFKTAEDLSNHVTLPGNQLGDLIYEDVDGDGAITELDRVRIDESNVPQVVYGITLGANFKGFDVSLLLQGQAKAVQHITAESGEVGNYFSTWADNRWSPDTPDGTYPRVDVRTSSSINAGLFYNDFWLQNASYLRLKNLEIGYTLPNSLIEKIKMKSVRVYANGFNLLTFTSLTDVDPEGDSGSGQFYPQQKIINLGVNVKF